MGAAESNLLVLNYFRLTMVTTNILNYVQLGLTDYIYNKVHFKLDNRVHI